MIPRLVLCLTLCVVFVPVGHTASNGKRQASPARPARTDAHGDPLPEKALARCGSMRLRVGEEVKTCAFWPDDRTFAALCADGSIRLWDRDTGREVRRINTGIREPRRIHFAPRSHQVAFLDEKDQVLIWDGKSGKLTRKATLAEGPKLLTLTVSPSGKLLALQLIESENNKLELCEVSSGRILRTLEGVKDNLSSFAFSPASSRLVIGYQDHPAEVWDVGTGKKVCVLPAFDRGYLCANISFSRDGKWIALVGFAWPITSVVVIADAATGKERTRFRGYVNAVWFSADGKTLITPGIRGLSLRDAATGKERLPLVEQMLPYNSLLALSSDGKTLATVGAYEPFPGIRFRDPNTGKVLLAPDGHQEMLRQVAFSADGRTLFTSDAVSFCAWDAASGKQKQAISFSPQLRNGCALSLDQKLLAYRSDFGFTVCDRATGKKLRHVKIDKAETIRDWAFSPDDKCILSTHQRQEGEDHAGGQAGLRISDLASGKEAQFLPLRTKALLEHLVVSPAGGMAIAGTVNRVRLIGADTSAGPVYVWDLRPGRPLRILKGHHGSIQSLSLTTDSRLLASGSEDGTFRLWELASGQTLFTLSGVSSHPRALALSPDGLLLATSNGPTDPSTNIHFWSTRDGTLLGTLPPAGVRATALAFAPDGRRLASGMADGTALVWDVASVQRKARDAVRRHGGKKVRALWQDLASADATLAHRALWDLAAHAGEAVRLLRDRLQPIAGVDSKRLQRLLADLDADSFAQREAASKELEQLGELAEPALRAAQKGRISVEMQRRIRTVLAHIDRKEPTAAQLREWRAVEVLERIGSTEARSLLTRLAEGVPGSRLTQEARAARQRLAGMR